MAAFFGWLYYDSITSSDTIRQEGVQRDVLRNGDDASAGAGIKYLFNFPTPIYDHNHSTAEIESISADGGQHENYHIDGLTQSGFSLETHYEFNYSKKMFRDIYCLWVENLRVEFSYTTMTVYVSTQYPEDSCEYKTTLDHENQHVQIHRDIYEKYQKLLRSAVSSSSGIPLMNNPVTVKSLEEGKARISELISGATDPVFNQFQQELSQEQMKLDTTENYHTMQGMCNHW